MNGEEVTYLLNFGEPDARVSNLPLLNSPKWFLSTWIIYFSSLYLGKTFMAKRNPVDTRRILMLFNIFQISFSFYIFKEIALCASKMNYSFLCQPLDKTREPFSLRMAHAFWLFYLSKYIDLLDSIFLVLKKKTKQLSVLHIYHHATMLFNWYLCGRYLPGGQAFVSVLANCFVHVVMYTYYLLSCLGEKVRQYLWWKKYLTQMQLAQFFLIIGHLLYGLATGCDQPKWLAWFTIIYLVTLISLFLNFYQNTYKTEQIKTE